MFLRCAATSEVFQLDQHGQSALIAAVLDLLNECVCQCHVLPQCWYFGGT